MESKGIPLVSGTKRATNMVIIAIHPAWKKNTPYLKWQSMVKNVCESVKLIAKFIATLMLCPVGLIFSGKISLGTSQLKGPHDQPKPAAYMHISTNTNAAFPFDMCSVPDTPVATIRTTATAICNRTRK